MAVSNFENKNDDLTDSSVSLLLYETDETDETDVELC